MRLKAVNFVHVELFLLIPYFVWLSMPLFVFPGHSGHSNNLKIIIILFFYFAICIANTNETEVASGSKGKTTSTWHQV